MDEAALLPVTEVEIVFGLTVCQRRPHPCAPLTKIPLNQTGVERPLVPVVHDTPVNMVGCNMIVPGTRNIMSPNHHYWCNLS